MYFTFGFSCTINYNKRFFVLIHYTWYISDFCVLVYRLPEYGKFRRNM